MLYILRKICLFVCLFVSLLLRLSIVCYVFLTFLFFHFSSAQVKFAKELVAKSCIEQQSIVILSPYNAQVSEIKACLREMDRITVTTITKSQGDCKDLFSGRIVYRLCTYKK